MQALSVRMYLTMVIADDPSDVVVLREQVASDLACAKCRVHQAMPVWGSGARRSSYVGPMNSGVAQ